ncbi:MAG: ChbG/HpnK family deacetylase [Anaerolineae bacterium]|nr:ChbG/HpnK family deacetylase [Anaerolineae bacterium]
MPRYLIVNADDFGHTKGVSEGILRAHRDGIVTSTSVMVNKPAAEEAIRLALEFAPRLGLGLHLNLTSGKPLLPVEHIPDLVQADGVFHHPKALKLLLQVIDMSQVEHELRAQIERFIRIAGRAPDHLDSHHYVTYWLPSIVSMMLQIAQEQGIPIRNPFGEGVDMEDRQDVVLEECAVRDVLRCSQTPMPDRFLDRFYDEQTTLGDLLNVLFDVPEGISELMCHPAIVDDDLRNSSTYSDRRADELMALAHPAPRELIAFAGIELISFGWFLEGRGVM